MGMDMRLLVWVCDYRYGYETVCENNGTMVAMDIGVWVYEIRSMGGDYEYGYQTMSMGMRLRT